MRFVYGEEFREDVFCKLCVMFNEAVVAVGGWTGSGESEGDWLATVLDRTGGEPNFPAIGSEHLMCYSLRIILGGLSCIN